MKVLHVQKVAGTSGSEAHLLALLPDLLERGFDVRFLMLHEGEPAAAAFARALEQRSVPVEAIALGGDLDPSAFAALRTVLARERPAVLHTHLVHGDAYGLPAGLLAGVPARVSTKHGFNAFRDRPGFGLADRSLARLAHRQIAISRGLARYLARSEGFHEADFEIVHYGIAVAPASTVAPASVPRFLCIGRLIPIKGHDVLLRAFAIVHAARPDARLEIAGQGPLEAELVELSRTLGVEHAVSFLGQVVPVAPAIERALAIVVPSRGEGFGMVALEAMERSRPVLASAVGGLTDIVADGITGLLHGVGDAPALAASMLALADDPARAARLGQAGRERVVDRFTQSRCTERTELVYRDLFARRDGG